MCMPLDFDSEIMFLIYAAERTVKIAAKPTT